MQTTQHAMTRAPAERARLHEAEPSWSDQLLRVARLDLSAAGMRVLLFLFAKAEATQCSDWTFPVEFIGDALGLHRNTVSRALIELQKAGYIRRRAGLARGAPTRTYLLRTLQPGPASSDHGVTQVGSRPIRLSQAVNPSPLGLTQPGSPQIDVPAPADDDTLGRAATHGPHAIEQDRMPSELPSGSACSNRHGVLTRDELLSMQSFFMSLPAHVSDALETAKSLADPAALKIDPAWALTDQQIRWLERAVPKRDPLPARTSNATPRVNGAGESIPPALAETLLELLPALCACAGSDARGAELLDEIACMVVIGGLGRGDHPGGARAGLALVRAGRWKRPKMMSEAWRGAVLRSVNGTPAAH